MVALDAVLEKFDASKEKVRKEIKEGFFHPDGSLRLSELELRSWIADRAVDELQVVLQLSAVISRSAQLIPAHILVPVTEQMSDEARHFDILRSLVPAELHAQIDAKVAALPSTLAANAHWASLLKAVDAGNPYGALLDINIVHEGYSAAAIEELRNIPFDDIREAYAGIGADEEKHHESGRDLLLWLIARDNVAATAVADAHQRADGDGAAMSWSWPSPQPVASPLDVIARAHERASEGTAMAWQWPNPSDA